MGGTTATTTALLANQLKICVKHVASLVRDHG